MKQGEVRKIDRGNFGYVVLAREVGTASATFDAIEVVALASPNNTPEYPTGESDMFTADLQQAEQTLQVWIKWDGCSEVEIVRGHSCGREDAGLFGHMLDAIYVLAAETVPGWDAQLAR